MDLTAIQPVLDWLTLHQHWVAVALVTVAFLESVALVGVIIPGVVFLFGISAIAGSGALGIWPTLACAFIGAVLGDCISFFLGKLLKERVRTIWPFARYPHWINNAEGFIAQHGGKSVVIGRFVGPVRPVIPLVVGMLDMSAPRFVTINLLSALAWAPVYILPGFVFGASLRWGTQFPGEFSTLLLLLLGIVIVGLLAAKLSHWHLSPESRLYGFLQAWVQRQHNVRLLWYWMAERRSERVAFPLPFVVLFTICFLTSAVLIYFSDSGTFITAANQATQHFFSALQHPLLNSVFAFIIALAQPYSSYAFAFILMGWLALRGHFSAAFHCMLAIIALEAILAIWLATSMHGESGFMPNAGVMRIGMISLLVAAFVAREIGANERWLIFGFSSVPLFLIISAQLYTNNSGLTGALASAFAGVTLGSAIILSFGRHQSRRIIPDWWFWVALVLAMAGWVLIAFLINPFDYSSLATP